MPITNHKTRIVPCTDTRDEPGGSCIGLGLCFDVAGDEGAVHWAVNTGWVHRPILTDHMVRGKQSRADEAGVDKQIAHVFPQPMSVLTARAGEDFDFDAEDTNVFDVHAIMRKRELMDALVTGGEPAVFKILFEVYREKFLG